MRGFAAFLEALAAREDRAALLDAARDEYTRLFVGPGALPAPTWESPDLTKEPTLFQENTLAVRAAYRAHGVEPKRLQPVRHNAESPVSLLLLEARRGGRPGLTLLPELLEYETDGTEREALRAARHAKGDCP